MPTAHGYPCPVPAVNLQLDYAECFNNDDTVLVRFVNEPWETERGLRHCWAVGTFGENGVFAHIRIAGRVIHTGTEDEIRASLWNELYN